MPDFYSASGDPADDSDLDSSVVRAEFTAISTAFAKLASYTGAANRVLHVNAGATGYTNTAGFTFDGTTLTAPALAVTNAATIGGGYGGSGATISADGAAQFDGALTVDGASTLSGLVTLDKGSTGDHAVFGNTRKLYFNDSDYSASYASISDTTGGGGSGFAAGNSSVGLFAAGGAALFLNGTNANLNCAINSGTTFLTQSVLNNGTLDIPLANGGSYLVTASSTDQALNAAALYQVRNGTVNIATFGTGSPNGCTQTGSGLNARLTNTTGFTATVNYTALRIG